MVIAFVSITFVESGIKNQPEPGDCMFRNCCLSTGIPILTPHPTPLPRGEREFTPSPLGTAKGSLRSNGAPDGVPLAGARVGDEGPLVLLHQALATG